MKVERPEEREQEHRWTADEAASFLASWCRVADKDGSTVAYAPDATTAQRIEGALDSATYELQLEAESDVQYALRQEIESLTAQRDALAEAAARLYAAINLASIPAESLDNYLREPMNEVFTALRAAGRLS